MADKTPGPKEAALRAQREARLAANKKKIDAKAEEIKAGLRSKLKAKVVARVSNMKFKKIGKRGK